MIEASSELIIMDIAVSLLALAGFLVAAIFLCAGCYMLLAHWRFARRATEVSGTIIAIERLSPPEKDRENKTDIFLHRVWIEFIHHGRKFYFAGPDTASAAPQIGDDVTLRTLGESGSEDLKVEMKTRFSKFTALMFVIIGGVPFGYIAYSQAVPVSIIAGTLALAALLVSGLGRLAPMIMIPFAGRAKASIEPKIDTLLITEPLGARA